MKETTRVVAADDGTPLPITIYEASNAGAELKRDVLLLHGWPNGGRVWRDLADAVLLGTPNYRFWAPDARGFGDSHAPASGYDCDTFARDAAAVARDLALSPYALIGHSMGGKIAQLVAARYNTGLIGLGLITPGTLAAPPPVDADARRALYGDRDGVRALLTGWTARPLPSPVLDALTDDALRVSQAAWNGWLDPMRGEDFRDETARITVPTLVVGGEKDSQRSEESLQTEVSGKIAGARYVSVPHVGHLPHLEDPLALGALLVNFLDNLPWTAKTGGAL